MKQRISEKTFGKQSSLNEAVSGGSYFRITDETRVLSQRDRRLPVSSVLPEDAFLLNSEQDLVDCPAISGPVAGVYDVIRPDTFFKLGANFSIGNNSIRANDMGMVGFSGLSLTSLNASYSRLTSTTSGNLFEFNNTNGYIERAALHAPNATIFSTTGTGIESFIVRQVGITGASGIADLTAIGGSFFELLAVLPAAVPTTGIRYFGSHGSTSISLSQFIQSSPYTVVDLGTATSLFLDFVGPAQWLLAPGGIGVSGLANSGNIIPTGRGIIDKVTFGASGTPLSGLTTSDIDWDISNSFPLLNTRNFAVCEVSGNVIPTAIATPGVAVPIAGNHAFDVDSSRWDSSGPGELRFVGTRDIFTTVRQRISYFSVGGSNETCTVYIDLSGVAASGETLGLQAGAGVQELSNNIVRHMDAEKTLRVTNGSILRGFVESTSSQDILVSDGTLVATE